MMNEPDEIFGEHEADNRPPDPMQHQARARVEKFIDEHPEQVFFSRQIEVLHEAEFFHWVTNRTTRPAASLFHPMGEGHRPGQWLVKFHKEFVP
jgi:hypothetical protein